MRRAAIAWLGVSLLALGGVGTSRLVLAGDPPSPAPPPAPAPSAPSADEAARIAHLVEDLGSDDFRIREAATKTLADLGEKARPALEAALKSDSPSVRFRAEQLLQRLDGGRSEKPLEDGGGPMPRTGPGQGPWHRFFTEDDFDKLQQEMEKRFRDLEEQMRKGWDGFGPFPGEIFGPRPRRAADLRARAETDDTVADLWEGARAARIVLSDRKDPTNVTTYAGKSIPAILEANPALRDLPVGKALLANYEKAKKEREEEAQRAGPGTTTRSVGRSVQVETTDGHVRVTVTEKAPDGKETTKTYEGTDLETLKAEHPELREALGGLSFHLGTGPAPGWAPPAPQGPKPLEPEEGLEEGARPPQASGPFGLALERVDDVLREQLGLSAGAGALVVAVRDGSDAAKVGLRVHDVITAVNGKPVQALDDVRAGIRSAGGGPLSFDVVRGGKPLTLKR